MAKRQGQADHKGKVLAFGRHGLVALGEPSTDDAGQPTQRFRARLIRPGTFRHPKADWTLPVDTKRVDAYKAAADKMLAADTKIPFTSEHFTKSADDTYGYVESVDVDSDGWLTAVGKFIGADAIRAADRNHVSVEIEDDVKDAEGNRFGHAITSIALTPRPVVTGQERIAASLVYHFDPGTTGTPGDHPMEFLTQLGEAIGLENLTEENWQEQLKGKLKPVGDAAKLQTDLEAANKSITELTAKVEASGKQPKVDADTLEDRAESSQEKLDGLVTAGKITPAVSDSLAAALIGDEGSRNVWALSHVGAKAMGQTTPIAKLVLDALQENDLVKLGEQTKRQTMALSRTTPGDEGDAKGAAERTDHMIESANKGTGAATAIAV